MDPSTALPSPLPAWPFWLATVLLPTVSYAGAWMLSALALRLARQPHARTASPSPVANAPFREPSTDRSVHWMERARLSLGPRTAAVLMTFFAPLVAGLLAYDLAGTHRAAPLALSVVGALLGATRVRTQHESRLRGRTWTASDWARSYAATLLVLAPHLAVALVVMPLMPARFTPGALALGAVALAVMYALGLGHGSTLARSVGLLRTPDARTQRVLDEAAAKAGRRPRDLLIAPVTSANVYTFAALDRVVLTAPAAEILDDAELSALFGHALAHLDAAATLVHRRTAASLLLAVPFVFARPLVTHLGVLGFYGTLVAAVVALVALRRFTAYDFQSADRFATAREGAPGTYARTLARVYEFNLVPAVLAQKNPARAHLYDRMLDAGITPDVPRPAPPRAGRAVVASLALTVLSAMGGLAAVDAIREARPDDDTARLALVGLTNGRGATLSDLALDTWRRNDAARSEALYALAAEADPHNTFVLTNLSIVQSNRGRCVEARATLARALVALERHRARHGLVDGEEASVSAATDGLARCEAAPATR